MGGTNAPPELAAASTPSGDLAPKADGAHQRDGKCPCGRRVGHGTAGEGSHETAAYHRYLGRPPGTLSQPSPRKAEDETDGAGSLQQRTEQHEQKYVGEHHPQGHAEHALAVQEGLADDPLPGIPAVGKEPVGHQRARRRIQHEKQSQGR